MQKTEREDAKKRIGIVAKGMLDGSVDYLEGSIEIISLRNEIGVYENDPDFLPFVAIVLEREQLENQFCEEDASHYETEKLKSIAWAKEMSLEQCERLVKRYT